MRERARGSVSQAKGSLEAERPVRARGPERAKVRRLRVRQVQVRQTLFNPLLYQCVNVKFQKLYERGADETAPFRKAGVVWVARPV